jgi:hypothetical protein
MRKQTLRRLAIGGAIGLVGAVGIGIGVKKAVENSLSGLGATNTCCPYQFVTDPETGKNVFGYSCDANWSIADIYLIDEKGNKRKLAENVGSDIRQEKFPKDLPVGTYRFEMTGKNGEGIEFPERYLIDNANGSFERKYD